MNDDSNTVLLILAAGIVAAYVALYYFSHWANHFMEVV